MEVLRFRGRELQRRERGFLLGHPSHPGSLGVEVAVIRRGGPDISGIWPFASWDRSGERRGKGCTAHPTQALLDLYTL